ncbi:MAG: hypothetical protein AB3A66_29570 (plasmid) [Nodularia sp. CChRGM 3473]
MSNEQRQEYVLTDGRDPHDIRSMNPSELEAANQEAKGTFSWIPYDPATMGRFLQPQSD